MVNRRPFLLAGAHQNRIAIYHIINLISMAEGVDEQPT